MIELMVLNWPTPGHRWGCYANMCLQAFSSSICVGSLDMRSSLFLNECSDAFWGCQMVLRNLIVIKSVIGCTMKHRMGCERIKMEFSSFVIGEMSLDPLM